MKGFTPAIMIGNRRIKDQEMIMMIIEIIMVIMLGIQKFIFQKKEIEDKELKIEETYEIGNCKELIKENNSIKSLIKEPEKVQENKEEKKIKETKGLNVEEDLSNKWKNLERKVKELKITFEINYMDKEKLVNKIKEFKQEIDTIRECVKNIELKN
jgi:hypothetical protein